MSQHISDLPPSQNETAVAEATLLAVKEDATETLAVVFDKGTDAPAITVLQSDAGVFTVLADGSPVAVVASSSAKLTAEDVLLVERQRA